MLSLYIAVDVTVTSHALPRCHVVPPSPDITGHRALILVQLLLSSCLGSWDGTGDTSMETYGYRNGYRCDMMPIDAP